MSIASVPGTVCTECTIFHNNGHQDSQCLTCQRMDAITHSTTCPHCLAFHSNSHSLPNGVSTYLSNTGIVPPYVTSAVTKSKESALAEWTWCTQNMNDGNYTGEWSLTENEPHGFGTMVYSSSNRLFATYIGGWDHGRRHGYGVMKFKVNSRIHGWVERRPTARKWNHEISQWRLV